MCVQVHRNRIAGGNIYVALIRNRLLNSHELNSLTTNQGKVLYLDLSVVGQLLQSLRAFNHALAMPKLRLQSAMHWTDWLYGQGLPFFFVPNHNRCRLGIFIHLRSVHKGTIICNIASIMAGRGVGWGGGGGGFASSSHRRHFDVPLMSL